MATPKDIYDREYKKLNYDNILVRVKKGKKEEYQQSADSLGLGQAEMIRQAIEEFIQNHAGENLSLATQNQEQKLSAADKKLIEEFNQLPAETQKALIKLIQSINQNAKQDSFPE